MKLAIFIGIRGTVVLGLDDVDLEYFGIITINIIEQMVERYTIVVDIFSAPPVFYFTRPNHFVNCL